MFESIAHLVGLLASLFGGDAAAALVRSSVGYC
jgi:hypothetical protein